MNKIIELYRSFLTLFALALIGVGALYITYFIFPFNKTITDKYKTLQKSWKLYIAIISKLGIMKVISDDIERIKNIKNSIIVSTHPSLLDIVILMSIIPNSTCFVAEKLARNPFFKGIIKQLFIVEGQPLEQWVDDACKKLNDGLNIIIFPMGGRHYKNEQPRIHRGASYLAYKSMKDIVVLKIESSYEFLQKNRPAYYSDNKTIEYTIKYIDTFNTKEYISQNTDEVTVKTNITKYISQKLYNKE
jgi:1-acyl-sn-glycerol-3-phosphate acyltransferase